MIPQIPLLSNQLNGTNSNNSNQSTNSFPPLQMFPYSSFQIPLQQQQQQQQPIQLGLQQHQQLSSLSFSSLPFLNCNLQQNNNNQNNNTFCQQQMQYYSQQSQQAELLQLLQMNLQLNPKLQSQQQHQLSQQTQQNINHQQFSNLPLHQILTQQQFLKDNPIQQIEGLHQPLGQSKNNSNSLIFDEALLNILKNTLQQNQINNLPLNLNNFQSVFPLTEQVDRLSSLVDLQSSNFFQTTQKQSTPKKEYESSTKGECKSSPVKEEQIFSTKILDNDFPPERDSRSNNNINNPKNKKSAQIVSLLRFEDEFCNQQYAGIAPCSSKTISSFQQQTVEIISLTHQKLNQVVAQEKIEETKQHPKQNLKDQNFEKGKLKEQDEDAQIGKQPLFISKSIRSESSSPKTSLGQERNSLDLILKSQQDQESLLKSRDDYLGDEPNSKMSNSDNSQKHSSLHCQENQDRNFQTSNKRKYEQINQDKVHFYENENKQSLSTIDKCSLSQNCCKSHTIIKPYESGQSVFRSVSHDQNEINSNNAYIIEMLEQMPVRRAVQMIMDKLPQKSDELTNFQSKFVNSLKAKQSKDKRNPNALYMTRFHNLTRLLMYNIVQLFQADTLERILQIPSEVSSQLENVCRNIKQHARQTCNGQFKTDFYTHSHYNGLFLLLDKSTISHLKKSQKDIEIHESVFQINLSEPMEDIHIKRTNFIKLLAFEILTKCAKTTSDLVNLSEGDDARKIYFRRALQGISKLSSGQIVHRF